MKLIIDIYDNDYENIKEYETIFDEIREDIAKTIKNGVRIPKGHGRLIDADSVNNIVRPIESSDCEWAVTGETVKKLIYDVFDKADTIIEADTERSN